MFKASARLTRLRLFCQYTVSDIRPVKASASGNITLFYFLPSQKVTLLLIPYHFTIPSASQISIFIKILFFNLSLLFLSNRHFFQTSACFNSQAFQQYFFSSLSLNLQYRFNTQTHDTPISLSKPITTHTEPYTHTNTNHQTINKATHTNTNHQQSHTHKPTINNNDQHTDHHTHHPSQQRPPHPPPKPLISKPKPPIRNPRH